MLQRIIAGYRRLVLSLAKTKCGKRKNPLVVVLLEERATPAVDFFVLNPPETIAIAEFATTPIVLDEAPEKPIYRLDLLPVGMSLREPAPEADDAIASHTSSDDALFAKKARRHEPETPLPAENVEVITISEEELAAYLANKTEA